jgi:hypothetical protein
MAAPTSGEIKVNIQAEDSMVWNEADQRPDGLDVFESDLSAAIAAAWSDVESAFIIASVPVTGGSSGPGGPLAGGVAALTPGTMTNTASFTAITDKFLCSFPDPVTEGVQALVDAVAQSVGQKFLAWVTGYTATLIASGGSCAWIPPAPPANPSGTPGPWTGGSIEAFPLAGGTSSGDTGMTANGLQTAIENAVDPTKLKKNQNTLQPALSDLIKAITKGFETTWNQWKSKTKISGGTGSGTAVQVSGSILSGAVVSPQIS